MFKVEVVERVDKEGGNWTYEENPALRRIIDWVLEEPVENFVRRMITRTCQTVGRSEEADNFWVRIMHSDEPKFGFCFHRNREEDKLGIIPDILAGFANDIPEFGKTIIHETLHAICWDEDMIERKAEEIFSEVEAQCQEC